MENSNVVEFNPETAQPIESTASANSMILNPIVMKQIDIIADMMASGKTTVPVHLKGSKADCFAIVLQAAQWGMNPFAVAQKTHLINGTLGYEAQLVNAVVSSSNAIKGRFKYEYDGDWKHTNKGSTACVRVGAVLSGDHQITWGEWIFVGDVTIKNSPLWKTAPKQQASYLAVKYWARLFCPEVILGVYSHDEFEETKERELNPQYNNESIQSEIVNEITLESVSEKIFQAQSMSDLKATELINELKQLPESDISAAQQKWNDKREMLKAEFVKNNPSQDTAKQIKSCMSAGELESLLGTMNDAEKLKYGDLIDDIYDSFR